MQRVDMDFNNIFTTAKDISDEFPKITLDNIREAIRRGSLGEYGVTYKLNTQTVCVWIREYAKNNGLIYTKSNQF